MLQHSNVWSDADKQPVGSLPRGLWEGAGWRAWCTLDWDAWKAESLCASDKPVLLSTGAWCVGYFVYQFVCYHFTANQEGL